MNKEYEDSKKESERLEKKAKSCVLTMSASDYASGMNKDLFVFDFQSVEAYERERDNSERCSYAHRSARAGLALLCEQLGAEVIVDVKPAMIPALTGAYMSSARVYLIGTALISPIKDD